MQNHWVLCYKNQRHGDIVTVLDEYENRLERRHRTPETRHNVSAIFQRFSEWCDENRIPVDTIDQEDMESYFDQLEVTDGTKRNHIVNIRAAFVYGMRRGVVSKDPTIDLLAPRNKQQMPRILSSAQLREMRDACPDRKTTLQFHLLAYTGMRRAEIATLPWDQVDLPNRTINVIGKGDKRRQVPIHPALGEVLADNSAVARTPWVFPGKGKGHIHVSTSDHYLRQYAASATNHDFRRTVATSLDANGVDEAIINEICGWARQTMLARHYRHVAPERLQRAILRLYADDPL